MRDPPDHKMVGTVDDGSFDDPMDTSKDRDAILGRIRSALEPLKERTPLPDWDARLAVSIDHTGRTELADRFWVKFEAASGRRVAGLSSLGPFLRGLDVAAGFVDPALASVAEMLRAEGFEIFDKFEIGNYEKFQFGITRAHLAIAESGTLVFRDAESASRLAALSPWVHVAVVEPTDIVSTIEEAIVRFGDDPNIVWATGPSKTADVEGILIEGVHGPGIQGCLMLAGMDHGN